MTKIQLTNKQHEEIQELLGAKGKDELMDMFSEGGKFWFGSASEISKLLPSKMARILYEPDSYEVVPQYKDGDKIFYYTEPKHYRGIYTVKRSIKEHDCVVTYDYGENGIHFGLRNIRHATPEDFKWVKDEKERKLWKSLGREVGEFRDGDVGIEKIGSVWVKISNHDSNLSAIYKSGKLKGFYPAASYVNFEEESE